MLVRYPEVRLRDGTCRVLVRIEYETPGIRLPAVLWMDMPAAQETYLSERMDAWAACLFLAAMRLGEPLRLEGALSDRLAHGIREYQQVVSLWYPHEVREIPVTAADYAGADAPGPNEKAQPRGVGLCFSGGIDSFFTLWSHTPPRETSPAFRITHGVFLEGMDIAYAEERTLRECREAYGALFAAQGMELFSLRSNIRDLYPGSDWGGWMGFPFMSSVAFLFGKLFRRFYLAGGERYDDWFFGKRSLLDSFLATETCAIVHDGAGSARVDKVLQMAGWEPLRNGLRVCYTVPNGLLNCCRCPKCLHAMVCLDLAGELPHVKTFPHGYTRAQLRAARYSPSLTTILNRTRQRARALGRSDIAFDITWLMAAALARGGAERVWQHVRAPFRGRNPT